MHRRLLFALAGLGVVAAAAWLSVDRAAPARAPAAARPAEPPGCRFEPGERLAFRLGTEVDASASGATGVKDHFNAVLSWQVLDASRPGQWLIRAAFSSPELVQTLTPVEQRVTQPLDASFLLRVGSDCRFEARGYPGGWQPETRRFVSSVVSAFEFAVSSTGSAWELEQTDGLGSFTASYQATRHADGALELTRKKHHYRQEERAGSLGFQLQVVSAWARAALERSGRWLQSAQGEERVRFKAKSAVLADLTQRFTLNRDDGRFVAPPGEGDGGSIDWQDPFSMPVRPRVEKPSPELVALSLDDALKRFEALYRQTPKGDAYAAALMLAQWLRAHPEGAAAVLARIRSGDIAEAMRPAVFLALEQCGTAEARAALSSALADKSLAELDRARASSALSDVPVPTRESAQALVAAARAGDSSLVAGTSVRALGHLAGRTDTLSPDLHGELTQVLRSELANAQDLSRAVDVVDAIGNTGNAQLAGDLLPRLTDPSESMREHAVRATRRMPAASVAPALLERLAQEPEPSVRIAIVETLLALGARDAATVARVAQLLENEPAPGVRAAMIHFLGAAAGEVPLARAALVAQFRRERVPQLLQLIGRYVSAEELR